MDLAFVINASKPMALEGLRRVRRVVPEKGHRLLLWRTSAEDLRRRDDYTDELSGIEICDDVSASDMVVSMGGDGTLLWAVRLMEDSLRPLLGINSGSLGFLTDTPAARLEDALEKVLSGRYHLDSRMLLEADYQPLEGDAVRMRGLNDVVLSHGPLARVLEVSLRVGDVDLGSTLADGVIVATPSGSTAYSLSAGGPIVSPELRSLILTPVNAHTLSMRPLVVGADEGIEIELRRTASSRVELTVDGGPGCEVREGERIRIQSAARDLQLVVTRERTLYDTLRTKLSWGHREMKRRATDHE